MSDDSVFSPAACVRETDALIEQGDAAAAREILQTAWATPKGKRPAIAIRLARAHVLFSDFDTANGVLDEAAALWPLDLSIATERIRRMLAESRIEDAEHLLHIISESIDTPLRIWLSVVQAHRKARAWDRALALLDRIDDRFSPSIQTATLRAEICTRARRTNDALNVLRNATANWPDSPELRTALANQLLGASLYSECIGVLLPACTDGTATTDDISVFAVACIYGRQTAQLRSVSENLRHDWQDAGRFVVFALLAAECGNTLLEAPAVRAFSGELSKAAQEDCRQFVVALCESQQAEVAQKLVARILEQAPGATSLHGVALLASFHSRQAAPDLSRFHHLYSTGKINAREIPKLLTYLTKWDSAALSLELLVEVLDKMAPDATRAALAISLVESLLEHGDVSGAVELIKRATVASLNPAQRLTLRRIYDTLQVAYPQDLDVVGCVPDEILEDGHVTHYRFGETTCVVWFAGIIRHTQALVETECLPIWKRLGISVLIVHDQRRTSSVWGFGKYFPDRTRAADAIRNVLNNAGYSRIITCGTSLSGYSAITYGCQLGALGTLSFSGATYLPTLEDMPDSRFMLTLRRLRRVMNLDPEDIQDLVPLLKQHPELLLHHHFGIHSAVDRGHIANIVSLPNVRSFPADHDQHASLIWLSENGLLENAIRQFVAELR